MAQAGRSGRLHPEVGEARRRLARLLEQWTGHSVRPAGRPAAGQAEHTGSSAASRIPRVLVACSGGPDSLALAALTAHFLRRGDLRAGAIVVDHGLQEGSAAAACRAAEQCEQLGLHPVLVVQAAVEEGSYGPEMAARRARYRAFEQVAQSMAEEGEAPDAILLGHTRDDQAETVLLGLARGSGTRSLAGMPAVRPLQGLGSGPGQDPGDGSAHGRDASGQRDPLPTLLMRPLLETTREQVEQILAAEGLEAWRDPSNQDISLQRNRVRHEVLPFLEESLGPGIAPALARTAEVLGADAQLLDELALKRTPEVIVDPAGFHPVPQPPLQALSLDALRETAVALRRRILARILQEAGGESPTHERLAALSGLIAGHGNAGPVQMPGRVAVWRRRALDRRAAPTEAGGALILTRTAPA